MKTGPSFGRLSSSVRSIVLIAVLLTSLGTSGVAVADSELAIGVDAPSEPTVGEDTSISASISAPDVVGSHEATLTVQVYVDGERVATRTVTIQDGEKTTVSVGYTFDSAGTHTVTVEGEVTLGGTSFSNSASATVEVAKPTTVETPTVQTTSVNGAAFAVPRSLRDEVRSYREAAGQDLPANAFVLATRDELYVVFTQSTPKTGIATVEGAVLDRNLSSGNFTFGVIGATSASFDTKGTRASVEEVSRNSAEYRLELVRTTATYRRVSTLTDPDEGNNFTASVTAGVLVEDPRTAGSMFRNVGRTARSLSHDPDASEVDGAVIDPRKPHLHTVSFQTAFWTDAEATVDAIVLDPSSAAYRYVQTFDEAGVARAENGEPILYVVNEDFDPRSMDGVTEVKQRASSLDGDVVSFETRLFQQRISSQEVLEENSGCGKEKLQVKEACVNVAQDALIHGGVAWSGVPESRGDVLVVMGVSSIHQDEPQKLRKGRYRIVGEVVSTSRLNASLPEGSVLLVYELTRVGDIDYEQMAEESRAVIEQRTDSFVTRLRGEVTGDESQNESSQTVPSVTPGEPSVVTFNATGNASVTVEEVRLNATKNLENVDVEVRDVSSIPDSVPSPPARPIRVLNVSASAPDAAVANATIRLHVRKSELEADGQLVVYRYHDGEWQELNTSIASESKTEIVVRVRTPGFSYFAVATTSGDSDGNETKGTQAPETHGKTGTNTDGETDAGKKNAPTTGVPGFGVLEVLASLALVGWRVRSR